MLQLHFDAFDVHRKKQMALLLGSFGVDSSGGICDRNGVATTQLAVGAMRRRREVPIAFDSLTVDVGVKIHSNGRPVRPVRRSCQR